MGFGRPHLRHFGLRAKLNSLQRRQSQSSPTLQGCKVAAHTPNELALLGSRRVRWYLGSRLVWFHCRRECAHCLNTERESAKGRGTEEGKERTKAQPNRQLAHVGQAHSARHICTSETARHRHGKILRGRVQLTQRHTQQPGCWAKQTRKHGIQCSNARIRLSTHGFSGAGARFAGGSRSRVPPSVALPVGSRPGQHNEVHAHTHPHPHTHARAHAHSALSELGTRAHPLPVCWGVACSLPCTLRCCALCCVVAGMQQAHQLAPTGASGQQPTELNAVGLHVVNTVKPRLSSAAREC